MIRKVSQPPTREPMQGGLTLDREGPTPTTLKGNQGTGRHWIITFTFDVDLALHITDFWVHQVEVLGGSLTRVPGCGVDVTILVPADIAILDAAEKTGRKITSALGVEPVGVHIVDSLEWQRRTETAIPPELMSTTEVAVELGVSRQRVHQLRANAGFPAPLADLRAGPVWDAEAIRRYGRNRVRKGGRPRKRNDDHDNYIRAQPLVPNNNLPHLEGTPGRAAASPQSPSNENPFTRTPPNVERFKGPRL